MSGYVGRFAPSPSGDLHFGSLVTALASYLRARQHDGEWLLRIDDIDQTRCKPEFASSILTTLEKHGLHWDRTPLYQSQRLSRYDSALLKLTSKALTYYCECTRKQIKANGQLYAGTCRDKGLQPATTQLSLATRLLNPRKQPPVKDIVLGQVEIPTEVLSEDFVLKRRDGMHAYHLVSVVDDIEQGITEVVRGADLLFPSACQSVLFDIFESASPDFLHIPVASSEPGRKLSKQNLSPGLENNKAVQNLLAAGEYLGAIFPDNMKFSTPEELLNWLIKHWKWKRISPSTEKIVESSWC